MGEMSRTLLCEDSTADADVKSVGVVGHFLGSVWLSLPP